MDAGSQPMTDPSRTFRRMRLWLLTVVVAATVLATHSGFGAGSESIVTGGEASRLLVLAIFFAALVCELIDSSLGMGYGTTLTPLLLLAGFEPLRIVPCVLVSELVTGLFAGFMHQRDGNVDFLRDRRARMTALWLILLSTAGAVFAVLFAVNVPRHLLKGSIAGIIVFAGVVAILSVGRKIAYRRARLLAVGLIAAFSKGLSGGGYGPLATAGQVASGLSAKNAVAITSFAEAFTCLVGLIAYIVVQGPLDWHLAGVLTLGAGLSVPIATMTVHSVPERLLRGVVGGTACLLGLIALASAL